MSALVKPLLRPEALRAKLAAFTPPPAAVAGRTKLASRVKLLAPRKATKMREAELLPDFIGKVFGEVLGHAGRADGGATYG